ncbi:MAG: hypothetical protein J0I87_12645 [Cellulomonas sp.]|nr:hypothetical protein [Cellulomonas sp.]
MGAMDPWLSSRYGGVEPGEQERYKVRRVDPPKVSRRAARQAERLMMRELARGPAYELPRRRRLRRADRPIVVQRTRPWAWFLLGVMAGAGGLMEWLLHVGVVPAGFSPIG